MDLDDVGRFRNRAVVHRYETSGEDAEFPSSHGDVAISGVVAAIDIGELLAVDAVYLCSVVAKQPPGRS